MWLHLKKYHITAGQVHILKIYSLIESIYKYLKAPGLLVKYLNKTEKSPDSASYVLLLQQQSENVIFKQDH